MLRNPSLATTYLAYMGALLLAATLLHGAFIAAWQRMPWATRLPLPPWLLFPAAELLLLNLLVMPAAMYASLLIIQGSGPGHKGLGVAVLIAVTAYLAVVVALLLFVVRHKAALGLCAAVEVPAAGRMRRALSSLRSSLSRGRSLSQLHASSRSLYATGSSRSSRSSSSLSTAASCDHAVFMPGTLGLQHQSSLASSTSSRTKSVLVWQVDTSDEALAAAMKAGGCLDVLSHPVTWCLGVQLTGV